MRQPLHLRLRPFLRRDLRARCVSAVVALFVLTGLSWLGVSALSRIDSREAHALRVQLGLESAWAVCGGPDQPACNYDDREQDRVDRRFAYERRLRLAVLDELATRTDLGLARLDEAEAMVGEMEIDPETGTLLGDTALLRDTLSRAVVELSPAAMLPASLRRARLLRVFEAGPSPEAERRWGCDAKVDFDGIGWIGACDRAPAAGADTRMDVQRTRLLEQIAAERAQLRAVRMDLELLRNRDEGGAVEVPATDRLELAAELVPRGRTMPEDYARRVEVASWLSMRPFAPSGGGEELAAPAIGDVDLPEVSRSLASMARRHVTDLHALVTDPAAELWHGAFIDPDAAVLAIDKPVERYRSPVDDGTRFRLFGTILFLLAGMMLVLVGPVVTATTTAREREAGTLPVLRMTGLSAGDLALAMTIGPNVFALLTGGALLCVALPILALTAGPVALLEPLGLVLALAAATHLTAIGLGDALGQRVNAMVVGGLLGLGVLLPGLVGAVMVVGDMAATGLLLGPIPAVAAETMGLSGLPFGVKTLGGPLGTTILGYGVVVQALLGGLCLMSWRRRVEQAWAPLFRPLEGAALALFSVGCSALAVLDLSARINVQTYDTVNLITFVSMGFLMPVLSWLLVSSLVRPARAAAVASASEARRAFGRFQIFLLLTAGGLATSYMMVLEQTGLASEKSEVMWATLAQILLVAETAVATLLLASRRRDGKHRVLVLGAVVSLVQLVFAVAVYNLEVEHVAFTQQPGMPLMVGMEASPYWLGLMIVLWAAGLGLVLAALMRERSRDDDAGDRTADEEDADAQGQRWLH
jgi:hypothetical protein